MWCAHSNNIHDFQFSDHSIHTYLGDVYYFYETYGIGRFDELSPNIKSLSIEHPFSLYLDNPKYPDYNIKHMFYNKK